jgi:hypothetical protein
MTETAVLPAQASSGHPDPAAILYTGKVSELDELKKKLADSELAREQAEKKVQSMKESFDRVRKAWGKSKIETVDLEECRRFLTKVVEVIEIDDSDSDDDGDGDGDGDSDGDGANGGGAKDRVENDSGANGGSGGGGSNSGTGSGTGGGQGTMKTRSGGQKRSLPEGEGDGAGSNHKRQKREKVPPVKFEPEGLPQRSKPKTPTNTKKAVDVKTVVARLCLSDSAREGQRHITVYSPESVETQDGDEVEVTDEASTEDLLRVLSSRVSERTSFRARLNRAKAIIVLGKREGCEIRQVKKGETRLSAYELVYKTDGGEECIKPINHSGNAVKNAKALANKVANRGDMNEDEIVAFISRIDRSQLAEYLRIHCYRHGVEYYVAVNVIGLAEAVKALDDNSE